MTSPGERSPEVAILLATYNGELYLRAQLDSLIEQTHPGWKLFIRDDCSSDSTRELIAHYCALDPRIVQIDTSGSNLGPRQSFDRLLQHVRHDFGYVMFCDQDDEWLPDKVAISLKRMRELERQHPETPLLLHSDLVITDSSGLVLCPSLWAYSGINPLINCVSRLLFQNTVTGCTALLNRPLLDFLDEIPATAVMHDWWVALVAACLGRIESVQRPTVRYRLHASNVCGARKRTKLAFVKAARLLAADPGLWHRRRYEILEQPLEQAAALLAHFQDRLSPDTRCLLSGLSRLEQMPWWRRRHFLVQQRCLRQRTSHNAALLLLA